MASPKPPKGFIPLGLLGWLALTGLSLATHDAADGGAGDAIAWLHEISAALAPVSLAVAVGGGLVAWWQRREMRRRTQIVVLGRLRRLMWELGRLVHALRLAGAEATGLPGATVSIRLDAFDMPVTEAKVQALRELSTVLGLAQLHTRVRPADQPDRAAALLHSAPALVESAGTVTQLADELTEYLDLGLATQLVAAADALEASALRAADPIQGAKLDAKDRLELSALAYQETLAKAAEFADQVRAIYEGVRAAPPPSAKPLIDNWTASGDRAERSLQEVAAEVAAARHRQDAASDSTRHGESGPDPSAT